MNLIVSETDQRTLQGWLKSRAVGGKQKVRAKINLLSAEGLPTRQLLQKLKVSNPTLTRWRCRYQEKGIEALKKERTRAPGVARLPQEKIQEVLTLTMTGKPTHAMHWSSRSMAKQLGISKTSVHRIWRAHKLKLHQVKGFKVSKDPLFAKKLRDVIGLYLNPPEKAVVFSVDEKSQIQALDRTQPGFPLKRGHCGTMTHDYKRHGTTTLFAALDMLDGTVIGECLPRHRSQDFIRFLKTIDQSTPSELDLHLIVDNYSTHKSPAGNAGLNDTPACISILRPPARRG